MAALPGPRRSLGYQLTAWYEHYLCHGPGDVQGQPIHLDDELAAFVVKAYQIDGRGRRTFDEAFFSRAKGRAKSELAGMVVCGEFVGPARFDHWATAGETLYCNTCDEVVYEYEAGEPVGRPVTYPFIRCLATEEGQAGNTYDNVTYMLAHLVEHHGDDFPTIDLGVRAQTSTRVFLEGGGEIRPSTASNASKDGGKETCSVFDETHLYVLPELRLMYETVARNGLKRLDAEPWIFQTSTMYGIGEDSVAERTHKARAALPRLLFDHVEAPANLDPDRREDRIAGLKVAYGPAAAWMMLDKIADAYDDPRKERSDWLRYFWNRAVAGASTFVDATTWAALATEGPALRPKDRVALGFDGSRSDDSTALVAVRMSDCRLFTLGLWERPRKAPGGWRVPRDEVDKTVADAFAAYDVVAMWCDPYKWESYVDAWEGRWGSKRVSEEPTNSERRFDQDVRLFLELVKSRGLSHDGDEDLARHVANAALAKGKKRSANDDDDALGRNYLRVVKKKSGLKIDAAVAAVLAVAARGWAVENGLAEQRRKVPSASYV